MLLQNRYLKILKNPYTHYSALGLFVGSAIIYSTEFGIMVSLAFLMVVVLTDNPLNALIVLIILIPLSGTELFRNSIMNIPGAKPIQILALYTIFLAILNQRDSTKMPKLGSIFIASLLILFAISIFRSLPHLEMINLLATEQLDSGRFLLSEFIKPLLYLTPFFLILKYVNNPDKLEVILQALIAAVILLSIFVLFLYVFKVPDKTNVEVISKYYSDTMTLHRNNLATFYILAFPIILANYFIKKNLSSIFILILTLVAIGFLYSRGAYLTVLLSFLLYLVVSRRTKYLPILIVLGIGASFFLSTSIVERATVGLQSGDMAEISAGRVDNIWIPIISEYLEKPLHLIFGDGRYAITASKAVSLGGMLAVGHPHNMYLEIILDSGFVGFLIILGFYYFLIKYLIQGLSKNNNMVLKEYQIAIIVSIIAFLFSGFTDRSFFPNLENCFLWTVLAVGFKLIDILNHQSSSSMTRMSRSK